MSEAPEMRTQRRHWYVEIGVMDVCGGIGRWEETTESVEVCSHAEAMALRDKWLADGKLVRMTWGGISTHTAYGLFRIRSEWKDVAEAAKEPTDITRE